LLIFSIRENSRDSRIKKAGRKWRGGFRVSADEPFMSNLPPLLPNKLPPKLPSARKNADALLFAVKAWFSGAILTGLAAGRAEAVWRAINYKDIGLGLGCVPLIMAGGRCRGHKLLSMLLGEPTFCDGISGNESFVLVDRNAIGVAVRIRYWFLLALLIVPTKIFSLILLARKLRGWI
jgi:hypothetical protein